MRGRPMTSCFGHLFDLVQILLVFVSAIPAATKTLQTPVFCPPTLKQNPPTLKQNAPTLKTNPPTLEFLPPTLIFPTDTKFCPPRLKLFQSPLNLSTDTICSTLVAGRGSAHVLFSYSLHPVLPAPVCPNPSAGNLVVALVIGPGAAHMLFPYYVHPFFPPPYVCQGPPGGNSFTH